MKARRISLEKINDRRSLGEWSIVASVWIMAGSILYLIYKLL